MQNLYYPDTDSDLRKLTIDVSIVGTVSAKLHKRFQGVLQDGTAVQLVQLCLLQRLLYPKSWYA